MPARTYRRSTLVVSLVLACVALARPAVAQEAAEQLVLLVDRTSSMHRGSKGNTLYDQASRAAVEEADLNLRVGIPVRLILFDRELDPLRGVALVPGDPDATQKARKYLAENAEPRRTFFGLLNNTYTWTSIDQLLKAQSLLTEYSRLTLYWDGQAQDDDQRKNVSDRLASRWRLSSVSDLNLRMMRWEPDVPPALAVVQFNLPNGRRDLPDLTKINFGPDQTTTVDIPAAAIFGGRMPPTNKVQLLDATCRPVSADAGAVTVVSKTLVTPDGTGFLHPGGENGSVRLKLRRDNFPAGRFADRYEVRVQFAHLTSGRPRVFAAPRSLQLQIAGRNQRTVAFAETAQPVRLLPGESRDVDLFLRGNVAESGATDAATITVENPPAGVDCKLSNVAAAAAGDAQVHDSSTPDRLSVPLPASEQYVKLTCHLSGTAEGEAKVTVVARVADSSARVIIPVEVRRPAVTAQWKFGTPAELAEYRSGGEDWVEIKQSPLCVRRYGTSGDGLKLRLSADDADADVELAVLKPGTAAPTEKLTETTLDAAANTDVRVFARWKAFPGRDVRAPKLTLAEVPDAARQYGIDLTQKLSLDGGFVVGAADFTLLHTDAVPEPAKRELVLPRVKQVIQSSVQNQFELTWTQGLAAEKQLRLSVVPHELPGDTRVSVFDQQATMANGKPFQIDLTAKQVQARGLTFAVFSTLNTGEGPAALNFSVSLVPVDQKSADKIRDWDVRASYDVTVPFVAVKSRPSATAPSALYLGSESDVASIDATASGTDANLNVQWEDTASPPLGLALGGGYRVGAVAQQTLHVADGESPSVGIYVKPTLPENVKVLASDMKKSRTLRATIRPVGSLQMRVDGRPVDRLTVDVPVQFPASQLRVAWQGRTYTQIVLPRVAPYAFQVKTDGRQYHTLQLPIRPGIAYLPAGTLSAAERSIELIPKVVAAGGVLADDVAFEINGAVHPTLTVDELRQAKPENVGLLLKSKLARSPGLFEGRSSDAKISVGPVATREGLIDPLLVTVHVIVAPRVARWQLVAALAVGLPLLAAIYRLATRSRKPPPPPPGGTSATGNAFNPLGDL